MTGQVLGQPAYMAPETITQGVLEPRTDLYALGITLFELAAGRRPFTGKSLADILGEQIKLTHLHSHQSDLIYPLSFASLYTRSYRRNHRIVFLQPMTLCASSI